MHSTAAPEAFKEGVRLLHGGDDGLLAAFWGGAKSNSGRVYKVWGLGFRV